MPDPRQTLDKAIAEWRRDNPEDDRADGNPELQRDALEFCGPDCGCSDPACPCNGIKQGSHHA